VVTGNHLGSDPAELVGHELPEMGQAHRDERTGNTDRVQPHERNGHGLAGTVPVVQSDPTGFSSPIGQLIVAGMLLASLIVLIRWWRQQNKR
jgi:hypothetical protein